MQPRRARRYLRHVRPIFALPCSDKQHMSRKSGVYNSLHTDLQVNFSLNSSRYIARLAQQMHPTFYANIPGRAAQLPIPGTRTTIARAGQANVASTRLACCAGKQVEILMTMMMVTSMSKLRTEERNMRVRMVALVGRRRCNKDLGRNWKNLLSWVSTLKPRPDEALMSAVNRLFNAQHRYANYFLS